MADLLKVKESDLEYRGEESDGKITYSCRTHCGTLWIYKKPAKPDAKGHTHVWQAIFIEHFDKGRLLRYESDGFIEKADALEKGNRFYAKCQQFAIDLPMWNLATALYNLSADHVQPYDRASVCMVKDMFEGGDRLATRAWQVADEVWAKYGKRITKG